MLRVTLAPAPGRTRGSVVRREWPLYPGDFGVYRCIYWMMNSRFGLGV